MGCINSTTKTKLNASHPIENVFRVRVVRLQPEYRSGWLELNPRELLFFPQSRDDQVVWALQHLRRYGLSGDVFSFEAGRRCMSGPGIYTFRCQEESGEQLYHLFQRYVNAVALVTDADAYAERERGVGDRVHPSHTLGHLRPGSDVLHQPHAPHSNNYLEPAPLAMGATLRAALQESFSSSPLSLELDSPDSVPSLSFTNEVVHFHPAATQGGAYSNTINSGGNVYLEHPLRAVGFGSGGGVLVGGGVAHTEHNNNDYNHTHVDDGSIFSTLSRKNNIVKLSSLDVPPEECAPMLLTPGSATSTCSDTLHMYANIEGLGTRNAAGVTPNDPAERCYENLSRFDLPLLLQPPPSRDVVSGGARDAQIHSSAASAAVNYIVLDLDQPRSPAQCSPKTCFGSGNSLDERASTEAATTVSSADLQLLLLPPGSVAVTTMSAVTLLGTLTPNDDVNSELKPQQANTESSLGYSTIDFIKTCALIKSSTQGELDPADHDQESRITRHSKCVRKAYSISE